MKFSESEKAQLISEWENSGKSAWAYAKEKGLCPQTFARWVKPGKKNRSRFIEIPKKTLTSIMATQTIIIEKGESRIHVPIQLGYDEFYTLFRALGTVA